MPYIKHFRTCNAPTRESTSTSYNYNLKDLHLEIEEELKQDLLSLPKSKGTLTKNSKLSIEDNPNLFRMNKGQSVLNFIGLSVSCRVTKMQIEILGSQPTNVFSIEVNKKCRVGGDLEYTNDMWTIKVTLKDITTLAHDL